MQVKTILNRIQKVRLVEQPQLFLEVGVRPSRTRWSDASSTSD